ncbi:hypothetical protein BVRB_6g141780 [Beta vulgaris subsp. vulgaris]|uniref:Uncharacterized protein n=1 Tax=Beta vulgaris subsp. vulgaris TaxID=3555 RepID=A0A0J8EYL2_BETVV|nr:hypothetical protein BVRB_6g141780 [Beta vulgaris subsp. vulgaris]
MVASPVAGLRWPEFFDAIQWWWCRGDRLVASSHDSLQRTYGGSNDTSRGGRRGERENRAAATTTSPAAMTQTKEKEDSGELKTADNAAGL